MAKRDRKKDYKGTILNRRIRELNQVISNSRSSGEIREVAEEALKKLLIEL